ncbi:Pleiotropic drug resistance protein 2 [Bienertia sinuspersici]
MSVPSQQHQKPTALQQQQKTLAQQSNLVTNSSVPQQCQTTFSDPQQDKQAKFLPLKRKELPVMSPPVTSEPIQPLHHPFMHMNEDTQHMERSPPSTHAVSESRLQRDLENSSSESEASTKEVIEMYVQLKQYLQDLDVVLLSRLAGTYVDGKRHLVRGPVQLEMFGMIGRYCKKRNVLSCWGIELA